MVAVAWTRGITRFQNGGGLEFMSCLYTPILVQYNHI